MSNESLTPGAPGHWYKDHVNISEETIVQDLRNSFSPRRNIDSRI